MVRKEAVAPGEGRWLESATNLQCSRVAGLDGLRYSSTYFCNYTFCYNYKRLLDKQVLLKRNLLDKIIYVYIYLNLLSNKYFLRFDFKIQCLCNTLTRFYTYILS